MIFCYNIFISDNFKGRNSNNYYFFIMSDQEVEGKLIGKIIHYFDNAQVAVIKLSDNLKEGETIRIVGGDTDFEQEVASMEIEHEKISKAKKEEEIGLKVKQKVRVGYRVYKV